MRGYGNLLMLTVATVLLAGAVSPMSVAGIIDKIIVVVNDEVITQSEVDQRVDAVFGQYRTVYGESVYEERTKEAREKVLHQLITDKLVLSEAKRRKIEIKDEEIKREIQTIKERFADEKAFTAELENRRMTMSKLEENVRESLMSRKIVQQEVNSKVVVSPNELYDYYVKYKSEFSKPESVRVYMITVRVKDNKTDNARTLAEGILARLKGGEDFSDLARKLSDDLYAQNGGDMGYIGRGEMLKSIDDVIFTLKPGEISDVVTTDLGYHIFKVADKKEPEDVPFEKVTEDIEKKIYNARFTEKMDQFIKDLEKKAYIDFK